jgi:hypothetical protein
MTVTKATYQPEINLWASVLELALIDFSSVLKDERENARDWIFAKDQKPINSFDSICLLFKIDPNFARAELLKDPIAIRHRLTGKPKSPIYDNLSELMKD